MLSRLPDFARLWLWSMALFVLTLWLGTRHNDFPWYYHPDEPGKVEQVLGTRALNFHHPMLLLNSAKAAVWLFDVKPTPQAVVEAGRWVSAGFTAAAVVALSLLGIAWRGWLVGVIAGLALATHHQLFELSHYMKEDTALLFGLSVTFLAAHLHQRWPSLRTALLLGAGVGLAISGKVLGVLALGVAVPVFISTRAKCGWRVMLAAVVCALGVIAATNPQALSHFGEVQANFHREATLATGGQGMTQSVPHAKYWSIFLANTTPVMWLLIGVLMFTSWKRRSVLNTAEWATIAFPFALGITMSFFPKENDRYFLPATALFTLLAATAIPDAARLFRIRARRRTLEAGICALLLAAQFIDWTSDRAGLVRYYAAFQTDDTADLTEWLRQNTQPTDKIAKDNRVRLPEPRRSSRQARPLPNPIVSAEYAADIGTLEKLLSDGFQYALISESTFRRFERAGMKPKAGGEDDAERRRVFYADLRKSFEPVWARPRGTVIYLHPGLEVYRIASPN